MKLIAPNAIGTDVPRTEGPEKVAGTARYSAEYTPTDGTYAWVVQSTVAKGRVTGLHDTAARALPSTTAVLWHENAPKLGDAPDPELLVLQSDAVAYRGQVVALVVATSLEAAREAAALIEVTYDEEPHDVVLRTDDPDLYAPDTINAGFPTDTVSGSVEAAMADAAFTVDETYTTPGLHNSPMEPHATVARWNGDDLEVWDSNQAPSAIATTLATLFGLEPEQVVCHTQHVGGGFGSKGSARHNVVLAAMAAKATGKPVTLALTRQQMFAMVGYRTPTIQRLQLACDADGRLTGLAHECFSQSSTLFEFTEQTGEGSRHMYTMPSYLLSHRLARLDVPTPRWMRAPGEAPGMFALESAIDELALAAGIDPVELRIRNEPAEDPVDGTQFSSRNLVQCLREGAERFGWAGRNPEPASTRDGRWLVGTGVAAATYPAMANPTTAAVAVDESGAFTVRLAAADIGQGGRTVLRQIAADALEVPLTKVSVELGDSRLPTASVAGGSSGTASWGWAVTKASRALRTIIADGIPAGGAQETADIADDVKALPTMSRHSFAAHFVEVGVDVDTAEVRVRRALGMFASGRILNPRLARSQFQGGMIMGLGMALTEQGLLDPGLGDFANHDLAEYHLMTHADVPDLEVHWLDEHDENLNPVGGKGIGEIGIVGIAAAVANAVAHATGHRVRSLPLTPDTLLDATAKFSLAG